MRHKQHQQSTIYAEQIRLMYDALPVSVVGNIVNAAMLVVVLWDVTEHSLLIVWCVFISVVMSLRGLSGILYKRRAADADERRWGRALITGVVATGLCWGAVPVVAFPEGLIVQQALLAVVFSGMAAGAVSSLSYQRFPIYFFSSVLLVPLAIHYFIDGEAFGYLIGTLNVLFFIMIMMSARRFYNSTQQNIDLRLQSVIQKRILAENEQKYRQIFSSAPIGIAQYQYDGMLLDCNTQFCELIGRPKRDLLGVNLLDFASDAAMNLAIRRSLLGESVQLLGDAGLFGGSSVTLIRLLFAGAEKKVGGDASGILIIEDITEEKRVERLKNEFISTVSHELRTPLTSIRGSIKLLNGGVLGDVSAEMKPMLDIAETNTERLLNLVNDILDIGKMEAGALEYDLREVKVTGLVDATVKRHIPYAEQLGIAIIMRSSVAPDALIQADANRLDQVLANLLSNAAKFSPSGGVVEVALEQRDSKLCISVSDQGPGIPLTFQDKLFERFTQCDASDARAVGGTGLGLSIARTLVEHMGGSIGFNSVPGRGSTFYVIFPILEINQQSVAS